MMRALKMTALKIALRGEESPMMFNGPITHAMLEEGSVVYETVMEHDADETIDIVFLTVLSHEPSPEDRQAAIDELTAADPATGCGNLTWALLNTREFLFIQ